MEAFWALIILLIAQRLVELWIAKRNEKWMKAKGAFEAGKAHYKWIVCLHVLFFASLIVEVSGFGTRPAAWWPIPFILFLFTQAIRIWALVSLGRYWNTKIIVLPGANVVDKGPYRWIRHPNYVIVAAEILLVPLIFQAYVTALLFSVLNALILIGVRIPAEEKALRKATDYEEKTGAKPWFFR